MMKKYVILLSAILVILMFASTSSASFSFLNSGICERLQENPVFRNVLLRISQIVANSDNDLMNSDGQTENVILQETTDVDGEITPDNGNEVVIEEDDAGETPTIDIDGEEGATLNEEQTVVENGEVGTTGNITVEIDGEYGRTIERVIEIITENTVNVGTILQRVVDRIYAPGTTESDGIAENVVDTVVVVGGSGGASDNNIADTVVVTTNNQ